jgi:Zn-dependent protease
MFDLDLPIIIARVITLLIAFTVHELAHAISADYLGDRTPRRMGRITLNPIAHLDPFGTVLLILVGFGWAKPVMVNPYNMRGNPRTNMALVAAAGPASNLIMAGLAALPLRFGLIQPTMGSSEILPSFSFVLVQFIFINLILAFFNLIPIPPLDGSKILVGVLPSEMAYRVQALERYGPLLLLLVIFVLPRVGLDVLGPLVMAPTSALYNFLLGV